MSSVLNVIWVFLAGVWLALGYVLAGIWIAIGYVATAIPLVVSIIGIPLGIANLKLIPISLMPLGKEIVPTDRPFAAHGR